MSGNVGPRIESITLLDRYPNAAMAFSLRKLNQNYSGPVLKIRRSNDNAEQDIGFVNNSIDVSSLLSFVGNNNGFIRTWYDQSGNARNLTQTVLGQQPYIVLSGSILQQNNRPTIQFDGGSSYFNFSWNLSIKITLFTAARIFANTTAKVLLSFGADYYPLYSQSDETFSAVNGPGNYGNRPVTPINTNFSLLTSQQHNTGNTFISLNGNLYNGTNVVPSVTSAIGYVGGYPGIFPMPGYISELIVYPLDQSNNRIGIESNINAYYSIF
jgi:hypothetical protein